MTIAESYAREVVGGKAVTGEYIKKACKRFLSDLDREDLYFDTDEAQKLVKFAEKYLVLWEGEFSGKPVRLYPWQQFIIQSIFGWKYKETNKRKYRTVYIQIARKNGKTTLADIITAIHLFVDREATPQILVGANNEDQAKICTNNLGKIIKYSPTLSKAIDKNIHLRQYNGYYRTIISTLNGKDGIVQAMSKDPRTKDGFNPSLGIIDEYHEARNDALLNVIESGQGMRAEPLLVVITTAGFHKDGPCYAKLRKSSIDMLDGKIVDDALFSAIYEPDKDDDWKDENTWVKSNPMAEHIPILKQSLGKQIIRAINEGGSSEVNFKTKNLNQWMDAADVWIPDDIWIANHDPKLKQSDLLSQPCTAGLDLAQTRDLNAFALYFNELEVWGKNKSACLLWYWLPEDNIEYRGFDYRQFSDYITFTDGNHADQRKMLSDIGEIHEDYDIRRVHYDRYLAESFGPGMVDIGLNVFPVSIGGFQLSESMKLMEIEVLSKKLEHFNNPILRWNIGNLMPKRDHNGNMRPEKNHESRKIDGGVALILAYDADKSEKNQDNDEFFIDIW